MGYMLLVNPWICDFAAYDFWLKPLGLLYIAKMLKEEGIDIVFADFLDRSHPSLPQKVRKSIYGKGHFLREPFPIPDILQKMHIRRRFARYGLPPELLRDSLPPKAPSLIFVTSTMTYWYKGVQKTIEFLKKLYPATPVILGGIYATLCFEHAMESSGADIVIRGRNFEKLQDIIEKFTGRSINLKKYKEFRDWPPPAFELLKSKEYATLTTSLGCPYRCPYCASPILYQRYESKTVKKIIKEIEWLSELGVKDIAFYDDALLYNKKYITDILKGVISSSIPIRFHTPNALHARFITKEIVTLMQKAGFKSIYLGLESSDFQRQRELGGKVYTYEFSRAVNLLKDSGFKDISAYILAGLPNQSVEEVERTIEFCKKLGVKPYLSEFSPIPNTPMWEKALKMYGWKEPVDPLLHNNSLMPYLSENFNTEVFNRLKTLTKMAD